MIQKYNNGRFEHIWTFTDAAGVALTISGSTFACKIRKRDGTAVTQNFTLTKTGTAGELKASLAHADMALLLGLYEVEVLEKDGAGNVYHFHREPFEVREGILAVSGATWQ